MGSLRGSEVIESKALVISLSCTNRKSHIEFLLMLSVGGAGEEVVPAKASGDEEHGQIPGQH